MIRVCYKKIIKGLKTLLKNYIFQEAKKDQDGGVDQPIPSTSKGVTEAPLSTSNKKIVKPRKTSVYLPTVSTLKGAPFKKGGMGKNKTGPFAKEQKAKVLN